MSRQVEQALLSLMPTHGSDLPLSLVELAGSLLAQSRHRASTLKSEEEIARLYACANIACDRLKITLDLPPIEPRPPIPPRIYKRLYTHLDNILPSNATPSRASTRTRTPNSKAKELANSPASASRQVPSRATPTKERTLAQFRTPTKSGTDAPRTTTTAPSTNGLNPWVQPVARFICGETGHKKLAPTILAGMESIVRPGGQETDDEWVLQNITGLLSAIYFFVTMRVKALASGELVGREGYVPLRKEILALLSRARKEITIERLEEDEAWVGWVALKSKEFDDAVASVNERDWLTGDWYQGITDVVNLSRRNLVDEDVDMTDDTTLPKMQVTRADSMFQDKYDFLSEAKCADYAVWKESILECIDLALAGSASMEVHEEMKA